MAEQRNEFIIKPYFSQFNFTESWLQDQARKGLVLKDYDMSRYTFKEGDASNRRYRIMPVGLFRRRKEIKKWESAGWMHFPTGLGAQMFYTDDEALPEVYPSKDGFRKAMSFNIASTIFWIVLAAILISLWIKLQIDDIFMSGSFDTSEIVFLSMCAIPLLTFWVYGVLSGIQYVYTLLNSKPINHNVPYQRNLKVSKILFYGLFVSLGLCIVGGILFCFI